MVLTEDKLKLIFKNEPFIEFVVEEGTILTPSAKQFLTDKSVTILKNKFDKKEVKCLEVEKPIEAKYKGIFGESYFEKPEYMTQIFGNILVRKDSKRIILRGKIDTFLAKWLVLQKELEDKKNSLLNKDMESISQFIKKINLAEILDEELEEIKILGEDLESIKSISHNPKKYFNLNHLFDISVKNNIIVLKLNELRALSREMEIAGVEAFTEVNGVVQRKDLLKAFNRLSSGIYIMMLKGEKGEYGNR
ncbi:MAG: ethanolamine utilization protein [Cetobacterium sp.]|uniref:ethanolamine utilization protein n=1 Tax=Cetobacterium sp. TaxID=2071632 RepID=UPI002FC88DC7